MTFINMRNSIISFFLLGCFSLSIYSQISGQNSESKSAKPLLSRQIEGLRGQLQKENRPALSQFWETVQKSGTPLIEPITGDKDNVLVTFLWRGKEDTRNVVVFLQTGGLNPADNRMILLPDSDVWYRSYVFHRDVRLLYTLSPNDELTPLNAPDIDWQKRFAAVQIDPLNPKRFPLTGDAANTNIKSVMELPGAPPQPRVIRKASVPAGRVIEQKIKSTILNNERSIWIYLPAGYRAKDKSYPLVVLFDGRDYLDQVPTPTILDNLIANGEIPPTVAVFIDNPSSAARDNDLSCNSLFADFLAKELLPGIRQSYSITSDPAQTIISGSSYGGLAAACTAMYYPQVFGNVLSQSASFYWKPENDTEYEWPKRQIAAKSKMPLRFFISVGLLETLPKPGNTTQLDVNRRFRDVLKAKGYKVTYTEFDGAHEYIDWQGELAEGLIILLGKKKA